MTPAVTHSSQSTGTQYTTFTTNPPLTTPYTTLLPPTNTTTPQVPLKCFNGGMVQDGVCICPDEWSGDTCSIGENHFLIIPLHNVGDTVHFPL